jgi:hypothetical protein
MMKKVGTNMTINKLTIFELYNGEVKLAFDPEKHLYTYDGKKVDGTTGALGVIAKPALMYWAVNQAIEYLQFALKPGESYDEIQIKAMLEGAKTSHRKKTTDASDKGKIVHEWCEDWIAGKKPKTPINQELKNSTNKFLEWMQLNKVEFFESERPVYSKQHNFAGTLDFVAKVNGKMMIGDFKTSNAIYDEYWFQTSAYQLAYEEENPGVKIEGQIIVRIGKDGVLEVKENHERFDYNENAKAFLSALTLHRRITTLKDRAYREKQNVQS